MSRSWPGTPSTLSVVSTTSSEVKQERLVYILIFFWLMRESGIFWNSMMRREVLACAVIAVYYSEALHILSGNALINTSYYV